MNVSNLNQEPSGVLIHYVQYGNQELGPEAPYICAKELIRRNPVDTIAIQLLAHAALTCRKLKESAAYMSMESRVIVDEDSPIFSFGFYLGKFGKTNGLIVFYNKVRTKEPYDWHIHVLLAGLYKFAGDKEKCTSFLRMGQFLRAAIEGDEKTDIHHNLAKYKYTVANEDEIHWIYFITGTVTIRILKLADALRGANYKVRLFIPETIAAEFKNKDAFDLVTSYSDAAELLDILDARATKAIHCFLAGVTGYLEALYALCIAPHQMAIDIYDMADPSISALTRLEEDSTVWSGLQRTYKLQRFLLNHARNICARPLYAKIQKSYLSISNQRRIFFPELAWGKNLSNPSRKLSNKDGILRVVHGGSYLSEKSAGSPWAGLGWLAEKAKELGVHFHLYAVPWTDQDMGEYEKFDKESPNFHLHDPVSYQEWLTAIEQYDVAIQYIHPADPALEGSAPRAIDPSGTWANKMGDNLDAEIYTVNSWKYKLMSFINRHYGVGESVTLEEVQDKAFWDKLKTNVLGGKVDFTKARKHLTNDAQIHRLIRFYEGI